MTDRVIPLADHRYAAVLPVVPDAAAAPNGALADRLDRPLRDLRISVTDRCNFRCAYCMPKAVFDRRYNFLPHSSLLSFEEIARTAKLFVAHGVRKIRLTGGEPLLRKNLEVLVAMLSELRTPDGEPLDLTLTTNGSLLGRKAQALRDAGLRRVTVSLDALDDAVFRRMNDVDFPVSEVLRSIDEAMRAGLGPIKVNMVVKRGTNDHEIVPMARHFRGTGIVLRFIEYMDVGASNGWRLDDVVPSATVIDRINAVYPVEPVRAQARGETAKRWRYTTRGNAGPPQVSLTPAGGRLGEARPGELAAGADAEGEIGVISSVTQAFCRDCNRARLSTEGKLFLCLFANRGHDLRALLRGGCSDAQIAAAIGLVWRGRDDRYSELRSQLDADQTTGRVEMHYIGG